jgi:hypothetical protein
MLTCNLVLLLDETLVGGNEVVPGVLRVITVDRWVERNDVEGSWLQ